MSPNKAVSSNEQPAIYLISKDGQHFLTNFKAVQKSSVIRRDFKQTVSDSPSGSVVIPLLNVRNKELQSIIIFLENHQEDTIDPVFWHDNLINNDIHSSDMLLVGMDIDDLTDLIKAASHLDILPLADLCAWAIARKVMQSKSPMEVLTKFANACGYNLKINENM